MSELLRLEPETLLAGMVRAPLLPSAASKPSSAMRSTPSIVVSSGESYSCEVNAK